MSRNENKRQKKLAKKNTRRKKSLQRIGNQAVATLMPRATANQAQLATRFPVHESLVPANLFEMGMGTLILSRKIGNGYIAVSTFLLDVFCLGVKDAMFTVITEWDYTSRLRPQLNQQGDYQA